VNADVAVKVISKNLALFPDSDLAGRGQELLRRLDEMGQERGA